jgi:hypothetical protein
MTTHIKIEAEDSGLGIAPIYVRAYSEHGVGCVDRAAFTDLLDAWSDGDTTRSWDTVSASDDEEHIVAAYIGPHGVRIDSLRPVGETTDDRSLWAVGSLPFKTKVTPLTTSQTHALLEEGGMFEAHLGDASHLSDGTDGSAHFESDGHEVEVHVGWSVLTPDYKLVQIDVRGPVRVVLNESDIFDGDTEELKG